MVADFECADRVAPAGNSWKLSMDGPAQFVVIGAEGPMCDCAMLRACSILSPGWSVRRRLRFFARLKEGAV
ncbi:hypothetical protein [Sphingomonas sp.]|uniref:hypothetical protein n=1 Tax=Sphingomonas sp. TaxID=28214 RepID=UPI000DAFD699|nr:hypothetical protein [Sphingomonas sp.]PZU09078.1 MAG: hypothetical protein DI605_09850 [Sphingomonas sp.]